jgi:hypothetical protein
MRRGQDSVALHLAGAQYRELRCVHTVTVTERVKLIGPPPPPATAAAE